MEHWAGGAPAVELGTSTGVPREASRVLDHGEFAAAGRESVRPSWRTERVLVSATRLRGEELLGRSLDESSAAGLKGFARMIRRRQKTRRNISPRGAFAVHRPPRFAPALERLETRDLLAGNLRLDALRFVDANNHPLDRPMVGEQVHLRADWTATDVPLTSTFRATLTDTTSGITSLTLNSTNYSGGGNGVFQFSTLFEGWYASSGQHHIEVLLDSASVVDEANESDNKLTLNYEAAAPSGLPSKLLQPLAGQQNVDWSVVRYSDLDPRVDNGINPPEYHDYACDDGLLPARFKCGPFTTDQFQGLELQLANFASMDDGQTVYAVADGVVTRRLDGFVIEGVDAGDAAGTTVSVLGDVNGDGRNDLLIAAPGGDSDTDPDVPEDDVGEVYVVYGQPGGFPEGFELADLLPANQGDGSRGFVLRGIATDDAMGSPAVAVGDFNGDGRADFAIGAPAADTGGTVAGEVYVILVTHSGHHYAWYGWDHFMPPTAP